MVALSLLVGGGWWRVREGVLFFVPSSIGSCCFLLLVACLLACLLGVSLVTRVSCV